MSAGTGTCIIPACSGKGRGGGVVVLPPPPAPSLCMPGWELHAVLARIPPSPFLALHPDALAPAHGIILMESDAPPR